MALDLLIPIPCIDSVLPFFALVDAMTTPATTNPGRLNFINTLLNSPESFLQPSLDLHTAALRLAKEYLDPLALSLQQTQRQRVQDARQKRKRGQPDGDVGDRPLQLNQVYVDEFDVDQIWGQARLVLDAVRQEVARDQSRADLGQSRMSAHPLEQENGLSAKESRLRGHGIDIKVLQQQTEDSSPTNKTITDEESDLGSGQGESDQDNQSDASVEGDEPHHEEHAYDEMVDVDEDDAEDEQAETMVQDSFGLNDGFFSLDAFNKQAMLFERQDITGDGVDLNDDDDDIDWHANPMVLTRKAQFRPKKRRSGHAGEDQDNEDDGPTFGDVNTPSDAADDDEEDDPEIQGLGELGNTNDVRYGDFFAPRPQVGKGRKHAIKSSEKANKPEHEVLAAKKDASEENVQQVMAGARRDLFKDDVSADEHYDDDDDDDLELADRLGGMTTGKGRPRSTYERRQAQLGEEIRRLEAANVAKKEWTLAGEARAGDRPLNSLLEEDLDFERSGKPVPVITAEVNESIEAMIKRRIIMQDFDELTRRRPDAILTADSSSAQTQTRRGRLEVLDDHKASQSLAQLYEEDHLRQIDPDGHPDRRTDRVRKEHEEIEMLWKVVCGKLDGLSNWHHRPKPAKAALNIVADVPTIAMEDARPTATVGAGAGILARTSMLAPQEIYQAGQVKSSSVFQGEVVPKRAAVPVAIEEMSREQKIRRRRRRKERLRKKLHGSSSTTNVVKSDGRGGGDDGGGGLKETNIVGNQEKKISQQENAVLGRLKKAGVTIIGERDKDPGRKAIINHQRGDDGFDDRKRAGGQFKL